MRLPPVFQALIFWAFACVVTALVGAKGIVPYMAAFGILFSLGVLYFTPRGDEVYSEDELLVVLHHERWMFSNDIYTQLCVQRGLGEHPATGDPAFGWIFATLDEFVNLGWVVCQMGVREANGDERNSMQYRLTNLGWANKEDAIGRLEQQRVPAESAG